MKISPTRLCGALKAGCIALSILFAPPVHAVVSTLEEFDLPPDAFYNGSDGQGGFASGDAFFANHYDPAFSYWDGFAYSNRTDTTVSGLNGQYTAVTGGGADGSSTYAVGYVDVYGGNNPRIHFGAVSGESPQYPLSVSITNNVYTRDSITNGDGFAKKFGGADGTDPDWFRLEIYGLDLDGNRTGDPIIVYLADFRFPDSSEDYIVDTWEQVPLRGLGPAYGLEFNLQSSDTSPYGMNTPAYFAADNLSISVSPAGDGDADRNGRLDLADAVFVLQRTAGMRTTGPLPIGDADGNGIVDMADAIRILQIVSRTD